MNSTDVRVTLTDMWETRPVRPADGRKIAGVALALARRYDLDPTLVRVALVAAAFTGVGIGFYLVAWALLPGQPSDGGPVRRGRPRLWPLIVVAAVLVLTVSDVTGHPTRILAVAVLAALLFVLHRSRGARGALASGGTTAAVPPATDAPVAEPGTPAAVGPPAWDPLGAAPFAWDLPEPGPAPAPPPRRRSRVTPVTLALALVAGGVTALVLLLGGGPVDVPVLLGVVLTVLGGGLLVGAFTRSGRGLVPVALLAGVVTWGTLAAPLERFGGPVDDLQLAPTTPTALATRYDTGLGDVDLDLRGLDLRVPPGAAATPVATTIDTGMGDVEIQVPPDADVRFAGESGLGDVSFDGRTSNGPGAALHVDDLGADRVASGRPLVLTVQSGAGDVEVHRG